MRTGKSVRLSDIAKRAGVSPAAAGVVLTGAGKGKIRISTKKAELIRAIAAEMKYRPNQIARNLAMKKSRAIGVLIDPRAAELTAKRLTMFDRKTRERKYRMMIGYEALDRDVIRQYLDDFAGWGASGVLCVHHHYPADHCLIPQLISERFDKSVFIDNPAQSGLWSVGVDYAGGMRLLVNHLLERGRKRIGLVMSDLFWYSGPHYRQGYIDAMSDNGISFESELIWLASAHGCDPEEPLLGSAAELAVRNLVKDAGVDALIVTTDLWALEILNVLREQNLNIPQDIALASCGDSPVLTVGNPHITGLDMISGKVAGRAVDLLMDIIEGVETGLPQAENFSPVLKIGQST